jgi:hypothetical protein
VFSNQQWSTEQQPILFPRKSSQGQPFRRKGRKCVHRFPPFSLPSLLTCVSISDLGLRLDPFPFSFVFRAFYVRASLIVYIQCWPCGWLPVRQTEAINMSRRAVKGRAIAQAVSRRLPTAAARVRSQVMWDLWWTKWHWGTSVSPANSYSTDYSTLIFIYHPGLVQ